MRLPDDLPQTLRAAGLTVVEIPGWQTRGRPPSAGGFNPRGVHLHHTGDRADGLGYAEWLALVGRPDLPPPLAQLALGRDGTVYVLAAGRANHAGKTTAHGTIPAGDGNEQRVGIEAMNTGTEGWKPPQYDAYVRLAATLNKRFGWGAVNTAAHYETSVTGKWDPGDPAGVPFKGHRVLNMSVFRSKVEALMTTPPKTRIALVNRARARVAAVNMWAPGPDDARRTRKLLRRAWRNGFSVILFSEFNDAMAAVIEANGKWAVHRARPNSGDRGNAVAYRKPVWRLAEGENLRVDLGSRLLTMAGAVLEHRRTGYVLPVLALHNPHDSAAAREVCVREELDWSRRTVDRFGRSLFGGDWNELKPVPGTPGVKHGVDQIHGRRVVFSSAKVHDFKPAISDHQGVSVLVTV